ncbi:ABC transporter permease [uncultured Roseivirga sp.]|uniref:ABC transporter permease n=2 Tax=Roseivirga TaxID=290180 RepID=UPI0032B1C9CE
MNNGMLKNYLRLAIRNMWKNKVVSTTNILGLTIGISCSLLLLLYVKYERSFDKSITDREKIYFQVFEQLGNNARVVGLSGEEDYQDLKNNYSGIADVVKIRNNSYSIMPQGNENRKVSVDSWSSSANFFEFFGFPLIEGDPTTVLNDPSAIVLTESTARKLFGNANAMGKTVTIRVASFDKELVVKGIAQDVENTHIPFEAIIPWEMTDSRGRSIPHMWYQASLYTYIKLADGYPIDLIRQSRNAKIAEEDPEHADMYRFDYVPLTDMYLGTSHVQFMAFESGNINIVNTLLFIAITVLLVACINHVNLQTAKGSKRALEVGVRKVMGAHRKQLIYQFLGESVVVTTMAAALAVLVIDIVLPSFNQLSGKSFTTGSLIEVGLFPLLIIITLLTAFFSGVYPALVLSSFQPSRVLKISANANLKGTKARKVLIFFQFAISLFLIAVTAIAYQQTRYINSKELGFNKDQVLTFSISTKNLSGKLRAFQAELESNPGVLSTSASTDILGLGYTNNSGEFYPKSNPEQSIRTTLFGVDHDFLDTYQIEVIEGRNFDRTLSSDSMALIVNETFVSQLGGTNPLNEKVALFNAQNEGLPIIGVVKDFHFQKLHQEISPVAFRIAPWNIWNLSVLVDKERIAETLSFLETKWNEFEPEEAFTYSFVDQKFERFYESEMRLLKAITVFSIISIALTALGLFGMVTFVIERKTKEIGIRKVLGASVLQINSIIFREFLLLLIIAAAVASPLIIWAGQDWLSQFAYRIDFGIAPIFLAVLLTLVVISLTVGLQSIKAAQQDPVKSLRNE